MTTYSPVCPGMFDQVQTEAPVVAPVPTSDRQLEVLLAAVEAKANTDTSGFSIKASRFMLRYLDAHGPTSGEQLIDAAIAAGIEPLDDRHFRPVVRRLARLGVIRKAGYTTRSKGHGSGQAPVWEIAK